MNQPPQYPASGPPPQYQAYGAPQYAAPRVKKTSPVLIVVLLVVVGGFAALVAGAMLLGGEPSTDEWITYTDEAGGYTCKFPKQPESKTETRPGRTGPMHSKVADYGSFAYIAMWSDLPAGSIGNHNRTDVLDSSVGGAVNGSKGTLLSQSVISIGGHDAREYSVKTPDGMIVRGRLVIVGDRLLQQIVAYPENRPPQADFFFGSFTIHTPPK